MLNLHSDDYQDKYNSIIKDKIEPEYLKKFKEYLPNVRIIFNDEEPVGWFHLSVPENAWYSGFVFIYIFQEYRRLGIGTEIYKKAEQSLKKAGCNWWSSYPESDIADKFALSVGFDYTNSNAYMVHDGNIVSSSEEGIRQCTVQDYPEAPDIWSREYAAMHNRIGLVYHKKELNEEENKERYEEFLRDINNYYVLESQGKIVGVGSIFSDNSGIGSLAVDFKYKGKGFGTRLAAFLTNECIRRGCHAPCLYCEAKNNDAMHIYKKIGYTEESCESVAFKN